jgi:hypothetical protein
MKINKFLIIGIVFATMFSCKQYAPYVQDDSEPRTANYTIEELITTFGSQYGDFTARPNSGSLGLFSVDTIPSGGEDIIIAGRIISDDASGNMYKNIVIQDLNSDWSLKISIDASGISAWYPLGKIITIRCNGLAIGKYADMFQLGVVYFNNNSNAAKKGYEPGRIPLPLFKVRAITNGLPELDKIKVDTLTIAELLQHAPTDRSYHSRLVCIKNAYFNQKRQGSAMSAAEKIFAPSTNGIGFPQSSDIEDGSGGYVSVATSEYARFAGVTLPTAEYKGTVTAIVAWYNDKDNGRPGNVQLTLRFLEDLQLYSTDDGAKWKPLLPY